MRLDCHYNRNISEKKLGIQVVGYMVLCMIAATVFTFVVNSIFKHDEPLVYITRTGSKYHSESCGYLWASEIPIGQYEAENSGYTRCSKCGGQSNGTIAVNNYIASFCISVAIVCGLMLLGYLIKKRFLFNTKSPLD